MKRYKYLIFDADHTLIDFAADEREAFKRIFAECGVETSGAMLDRCRWWSEKTWEDAGLSNVNDETIQRTYHDLYKSHLELLFCAHFSRVSAEKRARAPRGRGKISEISRGRRRAVEGRGKGADRAFRNARGRI